MFTVTNVAPQVQTPPQQWLNYMRKVFAFALLCRFDRVRYYRWLGVKIGEGCQISSSLSLRAFGSEPWLVEMGNRVTITDGVIFITHDGSSRLFRNRISGSSRYGNRFGRILIHEECFIGVNAVIMPNVEIGPYSIVGVGSVVNKNIPPYMVYAGVPARPICTLDEYIERYQQKMINIKSNSRDELRRELTRYFWGEER